MSILLFPRSLDIRMVPKNAAHLLIHWIFVELGMLTMAKGTRIFRDVLTIATVRPLDGLWQRDQIGFANLGRILELVPPCGILGRKFDRDLVVIAREVHAPAFLT